MKSILLSMILIFHFTFIFAQNVGIGTSTPLYKLDVNGDIRANQVISGGVLTGVVNTNNLTINSGGSPYDFLMKQNATGQVGFKKGHGGIGMNYIIAIRGIFPNGGGPDQYDVTILGEIKLYAGTGNYLPGGWMRCEGQLLSISANTSLFSLLGTTYGGNGQTTFALPDLRGSVPVQQGTSVAGYNWLWGETSY